MTIPQAVEIEKAFLACLILDPRLKLQTTIKPEMLYDINNQKILRVILEHEQVDWIMLKNNLPEVPVSYITNLGTLFPTLTYFSQYTKIIEEKYQRRFIGDACQRFAATIFEETEPLDDTLNAIKNLIIGIKTGNSYEVLTNPELIDRWYKSYDKQAERLKTGIATIDQTIGGFTKTDLALILADTNVGKTTLLLNMAIKMAQSNKKILFFSLEMSADQLNDKLIAILGNHYAFEIANRVIPKSSILETVISFSKLPLTIVHRGAITSNDVIKETYNQKLTTGVDAVMVDYVQRLTDQSKDGETIRLKNIAQNLKNFALVNEIPIITPAQVDKSSSQGGKIRVENVAWAKDLANEADVALYLYEKELTSLSAIKTTNFQLEKELRLRVVKSRHSAKDQDILINFDRISLRMSDDLGTLEQTVKL